MTPELPLPSRARRLILAAPLVFLCHVVEEAPGFVAWVNRMVEAELSTMAFIVINALGFLVTVGLVIAVVRTPSRPRAVVFLGWISFLMLANGLLHLGAAALTAAYVPGAITSAVLYLPYAVLLVRALGPRLPATATVGAIVVGAIPMFAQGFWVLIRGESLLW